MGAPAIAAAAAAAAAAEEDINGIGNPELDDAAANEIKIMKTIILNGFEENRAFITCFKCSTEFQSWYICGRLSSNFVP